MITERETNWLFFNRQITVVSSIPGTNSGRFQRAQKVASVDCFGGTFPVQLRTGLESKEFVESDGEKRVYAFATKPEIHFLK